MINFSKLSKGYGDRILFSEVTFTLGRGERCAVVGRNGSGKTTLFRLIIGKESEDSGTIATPKHYRIGTLEQHIRFSKSTILEEALPDGEAYLAEIMLTGLGFRLDQMESDPRELSGGFALRLQLAKLLLSEPDCLLLDEPTNYLDIISIRWLEQFLQKWPGEMMVVSHDKAFLDAIATHTLGIYRGEVRKLPGNTEHFYEQMVAQEEIHEKTRARAEKKREHLQSFVDRFGAKATKASQAQSRLKQLDRLPVMERLAEMENLAFKFKEAPFHAKRMIEVDRLHFSYPGDGAFSIRDFSLHIGHGERIAIIGKNGQGKSTLLSLLAQHLKAQEGMWWISDNVRIGYFGQTHIDRLHPQMTIEEEVASANPTLATAEVKSLCGLMMFSGDLMKKPISVLSGGERSRVLLAKILATPCNVLLLDEPTHHLDMESIEALLLAINHFSGSVVLVTHDETLLSQFGERLVVCHPSGLEIFEGTYPHFLEKKGWTEEEAKEAPAPAKNDRKELRQERAAHREQIQKCEAKIVRAEKELAEAEQCLHDAVERGDGLAISKHSQTITHLQAKIDALFSELE